MLIWILLPVASAIGSILIGSMLFEHQYIDHVLGRTSSFLSFDKIPLLIGQLFIGALGEEIAFRGFFLGKGIKLYPYPICAFLSSATFAVAHFAVGNTGVVIFDLIGIFIDSLIYSAIYKKTGNCLISTIAHFLCNITGLILVFAVFR